MISALWHFTRPHAFIGTLAAIVGLYGIALAQTPMDRLALGPLALALAACLSAAVFIVGLNQFFDLEIDRINKPELPYAAGELSRMSVLGILAITLGIALGLAVLGGGYLLATVVSSMALGIAYSAPPVRLKRYFLWAALCILAVRGPIINLGLYLYFSGVLSGNHEIPESIWLLVALTVLFALVIAWSKDIPDTTGDARFGIRTLVMRLGPDTLFRAGRWILTAALLIGVAGGLGPWMDELNGTVLVITQLMLLAALWIRSRRVDPSVDDSIKPYYLFIWNLLQLQYVAFPLACLTA